MQSFLLTAAIGLYLTPVVVLAHHMGQGNGSAPEVVDNYAHGANALSVQAGIDTEPAGSGSENAMQEANAATDAGGGDGGSASGGDNGGSDSAGGDSGAGGGDGSDGAGDGGAGGGDGSDSGNGAGGGGGSDAGGNGRQ